MNGIPMSSKLAAHLVTLQTFVAGVGAFILSADEVPFGWNAHDVGLSLVWLGVFLNFAVVAIRRDNIPYVTSGVGLEGE